MALGIALAFAVLVCAALATPPFGVLIPPTAVHARGTLGEHQIINSKSGAHLKTKGSVDVATQ